MIHLCDQDTKACARERPHDATQSATPLTRYAALALVKPDVKGHKREERGRGSLALWRPPRCGKTRRRRRLRRMQR
eukprot:12664798-Alexandrium_andersonii.AAC.1